MDRLNVWSTKFRGVTLFGPCIKGQKGEYIDLFGLAFFEIEKSVNRFN